MAAESNKGISKLGAVISERAKQVNEKPLALDFGVIQSDYSLKTNTFAKPVPKGEYSVCRQLTLGSTGALLTETHVSLTGTHQHPGCGIGGGHNGGAHEHDIKIPEKMRSIKPGDRVLVAWVQNEAVVIDIVTRL